MMEKRFLSTLCVLSCGLSVNTVFADIYDKQDDQRIQDVHIQKQVEMTEPVAPDVPNDVPKTSSEQGKSLSISADELLNYPDLVVRAMAMAVLQNNFDDVAFLLPYYQKIPNHLRETMLEQWAKGMVAEAQGDAKTAVRAYRSALSVNNDASLLRLRLAMALYANKEYDASEDQFTKLLSEEMPPQVAQLIHQYLTAIKRQNRVSINGGINYLADKNINNAPKNSNLGGGWTAPKAQSAHGIGFNFGVDKKWRLPQGFFGQTRLDTYGKYYTDNKPYNELTVRVLAGAGHENARHSFALLPFVEKSYYAGGNADNDKLKYFSTSKGISAQWSYWLNPKWQASVYGEYAKQDYTTRNHLDGESKSLGVSALYLANAKRYYFTGIDYHKTDTKDADDSFVRQGVRAGVGQELGLGFSTRVSVNVAQKEYQGVGFFGKIQKNNEYGASVSVWHKKVHYAGITPQITWQYNKVDSNLPLYEYDKHRIFIEMSKKF